MATSVCIEIFGIETFLENDSNDFLRIFSLLLLMGGLSFVTLCYVYFMSHRNRYDYLKKRNVYLLSIFYVGLVTIFFILPYRTYVGGINFKCGHQQVLATLALNLLIVSSLTRAVILHNRICFNQLVINYSFDSFEATADVTGLPEMTGSSQMKSSYQSSAVPSVMANQHNAGQVLISTRGNNQKQLSNTREVIYHCIYKFFCWKPLGTLANELRFAYFLTTSRVNLAMFLSFSTLFWIPSAIIFQASFLEGYNCLGCSLRASGLSLVLPTLIITVISGSLIIFKVWHYYDALGIKKELRVQIVITIIFYFLLSAVLRQLFPKVEKEGSFEFALLTCFGTMIVSFYTFVLTVRRAKRESSSTYNRDVLKEVLDHPSGAKALALYLAESLALENLLFIEAVKHWRQVYDESLRPVLIQQAVDIYELYIEEQAAYEINISYQLRNQLKHLITQNVDEINESLFDIALTAVNRNLGSQLSGFMKSKYYKAFNGTLV